MLRATLLILLLLSVPLSLALPTGTTSRIEASGPNQLTGYCSAQDSWSEFVQFNYQWNRNGTIYGITTSTQVPRNEERALGIIMASGLNIGESITFECQAFDTEGSTPFVASQPFEAVSLPAPAGSDQYPAQLETYCKQKLKGVVVKNNDGSWKCVSATGATASTAGPESTSVGDSFLDVGSTVWPSQPFLGLCAIILGLYLLISYLGEKTKPKNSNRIGRANDDDGWY